MQTSAKFWARVGFALGHEVDAKEHKQATLPSPHHLKGDLAQWSPCEHHTLALAERECSLPSHQTQAPAEDPPTMTHSAGAWTCGRCGGLKATRQARCNNPCTTACLT